MIKILFVCHGNICRSPMGEFILKNMVANAGLQDEFYIESAATSREEIGNDIYPPAKRCLTAHGIPYNKRAARQVTAEDIQRFDYLLLMDYNNERNLKRMFGQLGQEKVSLMMSWAGEEREVSDPWYTGNFEQTYDDLMKSCRCLLEKLRPEKS